MKDYYGWRARIGLVYIDTGTPMEPECYAMAPEGVTIHADRMRLPKVTVEGLTSMMEAQEIEDTTARVAKAPVHSIVFGGTSASFLLGRGYDEQVKARMASRAPGVPVTTTSTAMLKALRTFRAKRVSFVGPYEDRITQRGRKFLEENGFEVLAATGMGLTTDKEIGAVALEDVYAFARTSAHPTSDAVFLSCTGMRTVGAIEALERDLGVPVVSAIQVSFWDALRLAGVKESKPGFGRLFDH
jgi:maleate isomerase